jgi:hypothetical protein
MNLTKIVTNNIFLILVFFILSCGQQTDTPYQTTGPTKQIDSVDSNQVKYFRNVLLSGEIAFKSNCAVCHCPPFRNCEPGGVTLKRIFQNLPMDSLQFYQDYVKHSKKIKTSEYGPHEFGQTLADSTIKNIIEYTWLTSRHSYRH